MMPTRILLASLLLAFMFVSSLTCANCFSAPARPLVKTRSNLDASTMTRALLYNDSADSLAAANEGEEEQQRIYAAL